MIHIKLSNKVLFTILAIVILSIFGMFALAQSNTIPNPGHTANQIKGWKLLATGSDWTEEAKISLTEKGLTDPTGITIETDQTWPDNRVNIALLSWPDSTASEIMFKVKNDHEGEFCVGGKGETNFGAGVGQRPTCIDYRYKGNEATLTKTDKNNVNNWIRLSIKAGSQSAPVNIISCPDQKGRGDANKGTYGTNVAGVICYYKEGSGNHWQGEIKEIVIEEADWSDAGGSWEWEIWYK